MPPSMSRILSSSLLARTAPKTRSFQDGPGPDAISLGIETQNLYDPLHCERNAALGKKMSHNYPCLVHRSLAKKKLRCSSLGLVLHRCP